MRKKIAIIAAVVLSSVCGLVVGCKKPDDTGRESSSQAEATVQVLGEITLDLYTDESLNYSIASPSYSSSDTSVVSVDAQGKLIAHKVGTADVFLDAAKLKKVEVEVVDNGLRPNFSCENMQVELGAQSALSPVLQFNDVFYQDFSVTYTTKNADVITLDESTGNFTALKAGEATVNVVASWRNVPEVFLSKEVAVTVIKIPEYSLSVNKSDVQLFAEESFAGQTYQNATDVRVLLAKKNELLELDNQGFSYELDEGGENYVDLTFVDDTLHVRALKPGATGITCRYVNADEEIDLTTRVEIGVQYSQTILKGSFKTDKDTPLPAEAQSVLPDYTHIYDVTDGEKVEIRANGEWKTNNLAFKTRKWLAVNDTCAVEMDVQFASKYIKTNEDFLNLFTYLDTTKDETNYVLTMDGYLVLENNLDFSGMAQSAYLQKTDANGTGANRQGFGWVAYSAIADDAKKSEYAKVGSYDAKVTLYESQYKQQNKGFIGTFDGQGYTIKGLTIAGNGLFPSVGTDGVIKNVAFADTTLAAYSYTMGVGFNGTMENVLIDVKEHKATGCMVAGVSKHLSGTLTSSLIYFPTCPQNATNKEHFASICIQPYKQFINGTFAISNENACEYGKLSAQDRQWFGFATIAEFNDSKYYTQYVTKWSTDIWDLTGYALPVFKTYNGSHIQANG